MLDPTEITDCPWASLWMTLKGYRSRLQSFDSKYLEKGDKYEVGPQGGLLWKQPCTIDWHRKIWPWMTFRVRVIYPIISPHADRHAGDISFTVSVCVCTQYFCNGYRCHTFWHDVWTSCICPLDTRSYFDVKYVKNGKKYDVGPMGFTLDDLERLKVKITNGPAIGMWDIRQSG